MRSVIDRLLREMTRQERAEVEAFAAFVIARRNLKEPQVLIDDISIEELMDLVVKSGSFDWLGSDEEDIYTMQDGEAVQWPVTR